MDLKILEVEMKELLWFIAVVSSFGTSAVGLSNPTVDKIKGLPEREKIADKNATFEAPATDCWWTGCHSNLWKTVGCDQYGKTEAAKKKCEGGYEFYCCKTSGQSNKANKTKEEEEERMFSSTTDPTTSEISEDAEPPTTSCWWTGCQNHTLAARGCEQFGRMATNTRSCEGGDEYYCCSEGKEDAESIAEVAYLAKCWWTGCQNYSLGARGCRHFGRIETNQRPCDGGDEYFCCPKKEKFVLTTETPEPVVESQIFGNCWWTGCQVHLLVAPGCEPFNRTEAGKKPCKGGDKYFCCLEEEDVTDLPLQ